MEVFYAFYYCAAKESLNKEILTMKKSLYLIINDKYDDIIYFYQKYYPNME